LTTERLIIKDHIIKQQTRLLHSLILFTKNNKCNPKNQSNPQFASCCLAMGWAAVTASFKCTARDQGRMKMLNIVAGCGSATDLVLHVAAGALQEHGAVLPSVRVDHPSGARLTDVASKTHRLRPPRRPATPSTAALCLLRWRLRRLRLKERNGKSLSACFFLSVVSFYEADRCALIMPFC
jgi:hypothetical protein